MPSVQHARGTRASLDALAGTNALLPGQIYVLTDTKQLAVALSPATFEVYSPVAGSTKITVSNAAPSAPSVGDLWVDTN